MPKKKFNTTALQNELEQSAFFAARHVPEAELVEPIPAQSPVAPQSSKTERITRPVVRTNERTKVRHAFDVFADQLLTLRQMALAREVATGKRVFIGDLVQEAIDLLISRGSGE